MLVASLQVHIGRPVQAPLAGEDRRVAHPRLEPYIEDVLLLAEVRSSAGRAGEPRRDEVGHGALKPGVGPLFGHEGCCVLGQILRQDRLVAGLAV